MARKSNTLIIVVGIVIVAAIVGGLIFSGVFKISETEEVMQTREPSISVSSQILEGNQIIVDSLFLDKPGYVVIHKDEDGKPGAVIGNSELLSGEVSNLAVTIDATQAGTRVFVMLHYDDDGDGVYGFPDEDKPVVLEDGVVVKPLVIMQAVIEEMETEEVQGEVFMVEEFAIEADDSGFYQDGTEITSLGVTKDSSVKITFNVRSSGVYFGGLDFRSTAYNINSGKVNPGDSTVVEFAADKNGDIRSYWPASNELKAILQIQTV